jgi:hypothetical protein
VDLFDGRGPFFCLARVAEDGDYLVLDQLLGFGGGARKTVDSMALGAKCASDGRYVTRFVSVLTVKWHRTTRSREGLHPAKPVAPKINTLTMM